MTSSMISALAYSLPDTVITNRHLAEHFSQWSADEIESKTGIRERRVAADSQCASDLAVAAADKLLSLSIDRSSIDYLLFCSQTPDSPLPATSCSIHRRLNLARSCAALDYSIGCSGFIYGLGLAQALISSEQARRVLLLTADTYNKYIHASDRHLRVLFGDGAAATLVEADEPAGSPWQFAYGTDGSGEENLNVRSGGARAPATGDRTPHLFMNGPEVFTFTLQVIPDLIKRFLIRLDLNLSDIDLFVFHQANRFMLEHLRGHLGISAEKFIINMQDTGNTVSSTIPIALANLGKDSRLFHGAKLLLVGFGVGYSWGITMLTWNGRCRIAESGGANG